MCMVPLQENNLLHNIRSVQSWSLGLKNKIGHGRRNIQNNFPTNRNSFVSHRKIFFDTLLEVWILLLVGELLFSDVHVLILQLLNDR